MKAEKRNLLDFLYADGLPFSVPLFQRPYSWGKYQCEEFWLDIKRASESGYPHFFGAIFFEVDSGTTQPKVDRHEAGGSFLFSQNPGYQSISLIDGQQRTLSSLLLISALVDYLAKNGLSLAQMSPENLSCRFLSSRYGKKIFPSARDAASFDEALSTTQSLDSVSMAAQDASGERIPKAVENKAYFAGLISEEGFNAEELLCGLELFEVVAVQLDETDDEQAIFEAFNSKGVPLVPADMVRNYILLAGNSDEQARLFETYWQPIQGLFGDDPGSLRLNNALRAWTVIRCKTPRARSDVECFGDFKNFFMNEYEGTIEDLLDEILSFCKLWAENYRYHAVKKYRSWNWAKLGRKTLVSGRKRVEVSKETREFYAKHYGVGIREDS